MSPKLRATIFLNWSMKIEWMLSFWMITIRNDWNLEFENLLLIFKKKHEK